MIDDVQAFLDAWRVASRHEVKARPDAAIRLALLRLGLSVAGRVAHGESVGQALRPFQAAVAKKDAFPTDPSTLDASTFRDGDRTLIDVVMGSASAVFAFDAKGAARSLPPEYAWSPHYEGKFRRVGRLLLFDASSIQDLGMRYRYRLGFLRRTPKGYVAASRIEGDAVLDDVPVYQVSRSGERVTIHGLDEPHSFLISASDQIFRRTEVWDTRGASARRVSVTLLDRDLRVVDAYLVRHRGQWIAGKFRIPRERVEFTRGKGWVDVGSKPTLRFDLAERQGQVTIRKISVRR